MDTRTVTIESTSTGPVDVTVTERGQGRPYLLLHGGGGPDTVSRFADLLAEREHARVLTPTHPGFGGTARPETLRTIRGLAELYVGLLEALDLDRVTVVGNSIGGWIAAEMAVLDARRMTGVVLVDAVGIDVPGHPVVDFFALSFPEIAQLSYHEPDRYRIDPTTMAPAALAVMAGNRAALAVYGGQPSMMDSTLRGRLGGITVPALVLWGEADRIVDPDYGRAYADAIPGARFQLLSHAGHLPQIERPDEVVASLSFFVGQTGPETTLILEAPPANRPGGLAARPTGERPIGPRT